MNQEPTSRAGRHARFAAFVCGTFALTLGLVLVLDPDDDDDDWAVVAASTAPAEPQAKPAKAPSKQLKVAKTSKLKPKKTAFKKRSKRIFNLTESAPPAQGSQRPRRGFAQTPHLVLPAQAPLLDVPDLSEARLLPGTNDPLRPSAQHRQQLIRGPPLPVRS